MEPIETEHDVEIPYDIAFEIPVEDPLRERLKTDKNFAREYIRKTI